MAEESNIMGTLKGGWDVASKLAGKGFGEVSQLLTSREGASSGVQSGLYWQRGPWRNELGLVPQLEFFEPHSGVSFSASVLRRFTVSKAERTFIEACGNLIGSRHEDAEANLRTVIQSDAQMTDGYFVLGCLQLELGRADEAVTAFQKALLCQQGLGVKLKKYLASFRMSLTLTPFSCFAFYPDLLGLSVLLSLSQRAAGNSAAAVSTIEQVLSVMPTEPVALFFAAALRLEMGAYREVVELLKNVLPGATISVANLILLGKACQMLGDVTTANELYRNALTRQDLDSVILLDVRCAAGELAHGTGTEAITQEYPEYVPFFERLGLGVGTVARGVVAGAPSGAPVAGNAPGGYAPAAGSAPGGYAPATGNAPGGYAPAAGNAPGGYAPATGNAPGGYAPATGNAPGGYVPAVGNAPGGYAPATGNAPGGYAPAAGQQAGPDRGMPTSRMGEVAAGVPDLGVAPLPGAVAVAAPLGNGSGAAVNALPQATGVAPSAQTSNMTATTSALPSATQPADLSGAGTGVFRLVCAPYGIDFVLSQKNVSIGRESGDIVLSQDSSVSHSHALVSFENGEYWVRDLQSTNGTWVNGFRLGVQAVELHRGDVVQVGKTQLVLV